MEWDRRPSEDFWDWCDRYRMHERNGDIAEHERRAAAEPVPEQPGPELSVEQAAILYAAQPKIVERP